MGDLRMMRLGRLWLVVLVGLMLGLALSGRASAFSVGVKEFTPLFYDDFNDGSIDSSKWAAPYNASESGGLLTHATGENTTNTTNFSSAGFTGATEWAYLFRANIWTAGSQGSARMGTLWYTPDIGLYANKGGAGFYLRVTYWSRSTYAYTWQSETSYSTGWHEIGIYRHNGANLYDIYVDGVLATPVNGVASNMSPLGTPATIAFGSQSSTVSFPVQFDYLYAGTPLKPKLSVLPPTPAPGSTIDFGDVVVGTPKTLSSWVTLTNSGDPGTILHLQDETYANETPPGGLFSSVGDTATPLAVGESTAFSLTFNAAGLVVGTTYTSDITFPSDGGSVTYTLKARVVTAAIPEPAGLGLLGAALLAVARRRRA